MFVAIFSVPIVLFALLATAAGLSRISAQRPAIRRLIELLLAASVLLGLVCVAFVYWFYTSFELTW